MRSALAKGLGVDEDAVSIDYADKTASVDMGGAEPDLAALKEALAGTKYKATIE